MGERKKADERRFRKFLVRAAIMKRRSLNLETGHHDLEKLVVLAIDCQASHSNPAKGLLVEIGWIKMGTSIPIDPEEISQAIETYLVKTKKGENLSSQVLNITGIQPDELRTAKPKKIIWQRLQHTVQEIANENKGICPAVIHYSQYENPFLKSLHQEFSPQHKLPYTIICTHRIFKRLFPGHPRKSLRAVAGYFGLPLPDYRRSHHHVKATAFIWSHLARLLKERERINTLQELIDWLEKAPPSMKNNRHPRQYPMEKKFLQGVADKPGIYRMFRPSGDLLYIGKAKSLKRRVKSYFYQRSRHAEHILEMLSQAQSLSFSVTKTALEAALLESDEIKRLSPPYNRALNPKEQKILFYSKDLRSYLYKPDLFYSIGPLPSKNFIIPLVKLSDLLMGKIKTLTPLLIGNVMATPLEYTPKKDCFLSGLNAFEEEFSDKLKLPLKPNVLMVLGTQFWQEKLIEKESKTDLDDEQDELEEEPREPTDKGWTAERIVKALKRIVLVGTFNIRRSRWFCRLSESTLAWTTADESPGRKNVILFEKGIPIYKDSIASSARTEVPPGHFRSLLERQKNFDILTYDRMRVVTTEMRRVIQEGRDVELCLHPQIVLNTRQLQKMLKWI